MNARAAFYVLAGRYDKITGCVYVCVCFIRDVSVNAQKARAQLLVAKWSVIVLHGRSVSALVYLAFSYMKDIKLILTRQKHT